VGETQNSPLVTFDSCVTLTADLDTTPLWRNAASHDRCNAAHWRELAVCNMALNEEALFVVQGSFTGWRRGLSLRTLLGRFRMQLHVHLRLTSFLESVTRQAINRCGPFLPEYRLRGAAKHSHSVML
jgi:hypothetical protein